MLRYPDLSKQGVQNSWQKFIEPYTRVFGATPKKIEKAEIFKPDLALTKKVSREGGELKVLGVTKRFGKVMALNNVSLTIPSKKVFGIIGASGCGKTTLLKTLIGFYKPTAGKITYKGKDLSRQLNEVRRDFGFATQDDSFYGKLTVKENLKYFGKLYGLNNKFLDVKINDLLKLVDLSNAKDALAENLSTGMKRRLDIACALVNDPKVLILDEPTQDLDPALRRSILNLIKKINKNDTTIIFTTHLLWEAEILCDEIVILNEGRVLAQDSPGAIRRSYIKDDEIHLETHPGKYDKLLKGLRDIRKVNREEHKVVVYTNDPQKVLQQLLDRITKNKEKLIDMSVRKPHLSEIFEIIINKDEKKRKKFRPRVKR